MKIIIKKSNLPIPAEQIARKASYGFIVDRQRGKASFVRRLGGGHYPRLHLYIKEEGDKVIFDLHLDQKQASYTGSRMHNAEHEGPVVEEEIMRLKQIISQIYRSEIGNTSQSNIGNQEDVSDPLDKISKNNNYNLENNKPIKKSWWKKYFNF